MGRQINYYMDPEVENEFVKFLFEKGFCILEQGFENGKPVRYNNYEEYSTSEKGPRLCIYKDSYGKLLLFDDDDTIDFDGPVIAFNRMFILKEKKIITRGRLWYCKEYMDKDYNWISKSEEITKDFNMLVRWIKKHVPHVNINYKKYNIITDNYINEEMKRLVEEEGYGLI